jgi:ribosomal protein S17E
MKIIAKRLRNKFCGYIKKNENEDIRPIIKEIRDLLKFS